MNHDLCIVGHITKDLNTTPAGKKEMVGGAGFYFSVALKSLNCNFILVTKLAQSDRYLLDDLQGLEMKVFDSPQTHHFENIYSDFSNNREQRVHSLADSFNQAEVADIGARYFHFGPLSNTDIPIELIKQLQKQGNVSLDAQGYLRQITNEKVSPVRWGQMEEALCHVDILKVNDFEAETMAGTKDMRKAAQALSEFGIKEVVITMGDRNSLIYADEKFHEIPSYKPQQIIDATGCGDTYMAGYLFKRSQGNSIESSGKFGAAMATIKMEGFGPFRGTEEEVIKLIRNP